MAFPTTYDKHFEMSDVDATSFPYVQRYQQYLADNDFNGASEYYEANKAILDKVAINADKINQLQDRITATQNYALCLKSQTKFGTGEPPEGDVDRLDGTLYIKDTGKELSGKTLVDLYVRKDGSYIPVSFINREIITESLKNSDGQIEFSNLTIQGSIIPSTDNTSSLGSDNKKFAKVQTNEVVTQTLRGVGTGRIQCESIINANKGIYGSTVNVTSGTFQVLETDGIAPHTLNKTILVSTGLKSTGNISGSTVHSDDGVYGQKLVINDGSGNTLSLTYTRLQKLLALIS